MLSVTECQKRARQCADRAQSLEHPSDRARWLQLADEWMVLSCLPTHPAVRETLRPYVRSPEGSAGATRPVLDNS